MSARRLSRRAVLGAPAFAPAIAVAEAASPDARQKGLAADEPGSAFAEHRLALQLSDRDPHKQSLVLSVANNVLKAYGPDLVAIEVVAFGPGIDLLRAESPNRAGVDSLISQGVRFAVCLNTIDTIERETGVRPIVNERAKPVQAGAVHLLSLAEAGFTLLRP